MFPNPQDALPLPPRPDLEQYKKLAKEMFRAGTASGADPLPQWTSKWLERLAHLTDGKMIDEQRLGWMREQADTIARYAQAELTVKPALTTAQFVLARVHGFSSWERFTAYIRSLPQADSPESRFEQAADAVVSGDIGTLRRSLRADPELVRRRSAREHGATLMHYVSANGVENFRQKTPANIVEIARVLLDAGAKIDAECNVYGGGATTLGLAATSCHPEEAAVQLALLQLLLDRGARLEQPGIAGRSWPIVASCLANGRLVAARFLAEAGAPLDLDSAAGIGRLDVVFSYFDDHGGLRATVPHERMQRGFLWACQFGQSAVVDYLVEHGADLNDPLTTGATGLHWAAGGGHIQVAKVLLKHGAALEIRNAWGGTVIEHAGWAFANTRAALLPMFALLLENGAKLQSGWLGWVGRQKRRSAEECAQLQALLRRYGAD